MIYLPQHLSVADGKGVKYMATKKAPAKKAATKTTAKKTAKKK